MHCAHVQSLGTETPNQRRDSVSLSHGPGEAHVQHAKRWLAIVTIITTFRFPLFLTSQISQTPLPSLLASPRILHQGHRQLP
jgi:hypothetical protein